MDIEMVSRSSPLSRSEDFLNGAADQSDITVSPLAVGEPLPENYVPASRLKAGKIGSGVAVPMLSKIYLQM